MVMLALVFFAAGMIIAALAGNFTVLLAGRTVQGIGAGGFITMTEIIVTDLVPLRQRGKWFGIISMAVAIGSGVGPVIGGSLAQNVSWVSLGLDHPA
jgi:MFS family permease